MSANTDTVSSFDGGNFWATSHNIAYNFVANAYGQLCLAPSTSDGVDITATNTACFDGDINIAITKGLGDKLHDGLSVIWEKRKRCKEDIISLLVKLNHFSCDSTRKPSKVSG